MLNCSIEEHKFYLLAILYEVQLDITARKGSHEFNFAETIKQLRSLALELLFEDDCFAIDLNAQRFAFGFVRWSTRRRRIINNSLVSGNVISGSSCRLALCLKVN